MNNLWRLKLMFGMKNINYFLVLLVVVHLNGEHHWARPMVALHGGSISVVSGGANCCPFLWCFRVRGDCLFSALKQQVALNGRQLKFRAKFCSKFKS